MKLILLATVTLLATLGATQIKKSGRSTYPSEISKTTTVSAAAAGQSLKLRPGTQVVPMGEVTLTAGGPTPSGINFGGTNINFFSDGTNASWVMNNSEFDATIPIPKGSTFAVVTAGGWWSKGEVVAGISNTEFPDRFPCDPDRHWTGFSLKLDGANFLVNETTAIGTETQLNLCFWGDAHGRPYNYPIYLHSIQVHFFRIVGGSGKGQ